MLGKGKLNGSGIRQFIIVTGMSGAGKTMTLKVLEDFGFITIDSLPPELLPQLFQLLADKPSAVQKGVVATVDIRNVDSTPSRAEAQDFIRVLDDVKAIYPRVRVIFLTASDEELLRRYERTRRVHPLSSVGDPEWGRSLSTREGIHREREVLAPLLERADVVIDTSMMDLHQHRDRLFKEFFEDAEGGVSLLISSFGFKHGVPQDSGFVMDVRCLPNPYYVKELQNLTGEDQAVQDYLRGFPETQEFMTRCRNFLDFVIPQYLNTVRGQLHIAVGCTGGRHRSVAVAEWLYQAYRGQGACIIHRDTHKGTNRT